MIQSSKKSILHVVGSFYPAVEFGGPINSTKDICDFILNSGEYNLEVLTFSYLRPDSRQSLDLSSVAVFEVQKRYSVSWINVCKRFYYLEFIKKLVVAGKRADVIHLTGVFSLYSFLTLIYCTVAKKKIILSTRGSIQALVEFKDVKKKAIKKFYLMLMSYVVSRDLVLLGTTEWENLCSHRFFTKNKTFLVTNYVKERDVISRLKNTQNEKTRVVFISRLSAKKGIERFLDIVELLDPKEFEIHIAGSGEEYYQSMITQRAESTDNIYFHGLVSGLSKEEFFFNSDIFLFPSHSENFGIVIAEALSYGVSVITSVTEPWAMHAKDGILVVSEMQNLLEVSQVIIGMAKTRKKNPIYASAQCALIAKKFFSDEVHDNQLNHLYRSILD